MSSDTEDRGAILFLDIDGVLFLGVSACDGLHNSDRFDKTCVENLNRILEKTGCRIIISSTWQNDFTLQQLVEIFAWNGVMAPPLGCTSPDESMPVISSERALEIQRWLGRHGAGRGKPRWCAVDDMDLSKSLPNFVRCDPSVGLGDRKVAKEIILALTGR
ncbi:MAG TPA: HAD domain-containing protein [Nitrososphaera sp.]|nr:HAD domain-containing protein [Nitrososphaera sp.]